jgi:flagellar hook-associated protein FlgK
MRNSINLINEWADKISQCLKAISKMINVKVQERESMMMDLLKSESGEVTSFLE